MSDKNQSQDADAGVFSSLGFITRMLHDALAELGLDKKLESAVHSIPDARQRLEYIARISTESAEKVIARVEQGKAEQARLTARAAEAEEALKKDPVAAVAKGGVLEFIEDVRRTCTNTDDAFTEILTAQSFHDLSGQVIQRVTKLATDLETELIKLLVEITPEDQREKIAASELSGPVVDAGDDSVVTSQDQVDNLLESLGF
ncbi:MAG: protein phosphatase CheZ [Burkholderiaceae bacterium]